MVRDRRRNSLRAGNYDYALPGSYFVTICVDDRSLRFGNVATMRMIPNDAGLMAVREWEQLPGRFANVNLDAFVVMPNHLHGIVIIKDTGTYDVSDDGGRDAQSRADNQSQEENQNRAVTRIAPTEDAEIVTRGGTAAGSLSRVVQAFKSTTTWKYGIGVRELGWPGYHQRLWQRSFYDHIIRDDRDLDRVRNYITDNPANWLDDREYFAWKESLMSS